MNQPPRFVIVLGVSSLRTTSEQEVLAALSPEEVRLSRKILPLDTRRHAQSIGSGFWSPVEAHLREFASEVLADLEEHGPAVLRYVGVDEVPTLVALGALLGDEHRIGCRDYDRDRERFEWPETNGALVWEPVGVPREVMATAGDAVLRVVATGTVHDAHVDHAVPADQRVADITLRPVGVTPRPGLLRAQDDVESLRLAVRGVLAELSAHVRVFRRSICSWPAPCRSVWRWGKNCACETGDGCRPIATGRRTCRRKRRRSS